jgi:hypothetical protein
MPAVKFCIRKGARKPKRKASSRKPDPAILSIPVPTVKRDVEKSPRQLYAVEDTCRVTLRTYLIDDWEMDYTIALIERDVELLHEWGQRDQAKRITGYLDALKERRTR